MFIGILKQQVHIKRIFSMTEQEIEHKLIEKLGDLKYAYRSDIRVDA